MYKSDKNFVERKKCIIYAVKYFNATWLSEKIRRAELKGRGHLMWRPPEHGS